MPADRNHRFGHGKAEALVALFQVVLIIVASIGIALRAIERIGSGATTANAEYGIGVSLIAIAATFALLAYQRHVIRQTESVAIGTDHLQIGRATSELQSLMRISSAVFCLKKKTKSNDLHKCN